MALFGRSEEDKTKLGDLEIGGLTLYAKLRMKDHAKNPDMHFTSEFSVPELLVTHAAGFEPVAQVTGCSVYHVGWQYQSIYGANMYGFNGEYDTITRAYHDAWTLALGRLQLEARMIGAHGVIGLKVHKSTLPDDFAEEATDACADQRSRLIQLSLAGTAVRFPGLAPVEYPTLTTLTGQEFYALRQTGCYPIGFAVGVSCYNISTYAYANNYNLNFWNMEMTEHTKAFQSARRMAMRRIENSAATLGGTGVVDLKTDYDASVREIEINEQHGMAITVMFLAFGTVIADSGWKSADSPTYSVSLADDIVQDQLLLGI